eukprot:2834933-Alexandrium_andersonii.AAC.1
MIDLASRVRCSSSSWRRTSSSAVRASCISKTGLALRLMASCVRRRQRDTARGTVAHAAL